MLKEDNHLLFAVEMKLVDDAAVSIRTFNDATPWFWRPLAATSSWLLDRSMHDYVFGFTATNSKGTQFRSPLDLTSLDPREVSAALRRAGPPACSFEAIE